MHICHRRALAASFLILTFSPAFQAFAPARDVPIIEPKIAKASNDGEQAISVMRLPKDLRAELWAAEPMLASPVALCVDDKGRVYVAETFRIHSGIYDVRDHLDWVERDLASTSVEDRMLLTKAKLGPNFRRETEGLPDRIVMLQDTTGSGKADKSTIFADAFNHSEDGIGSSVLVHDGNVYYTCIPNLWLLRDTTGKGTADVRKSLSYGYGVRYSLYGHDLHGLRFGPDGKLYFSIGDRGANVTRSVDGSTVYNPESGCVFRCNADGTGLELFATGLRNPQQLAFDQYGNLFTGDNNPDYGDPARWCYVVEGGDNGWRIGYQLDHNPVGGGPWMWEHLWEKEDKLQAYSQLPAVGHVGMGPSGVAYYPGTGLPSRYDNHLFMCDFHGGFTGSGIRSFELKPKGASFEVEDLKDFVWDALATDLAFTPDGGVMMSDWVEGWGLNGKGRLYHIFDPNLKNDPQVTEVKDLLGKGMGIQSTESLIKLLGHVDMRVRQNAQFELADRQPSSLQPLADLLTHETARLPRIHAIWALGQIADKQKSLEPLKPVVALLKDGDDEVRAQAMKTLGSAHDPDAVDDAVRLLADKAPRVRFFAAMALGQIGKKQAAPALIEAARANEDKDAFIRFVIVESLAKLNDSSVIESAAADKSASVRMVALLTMRRLADARVARFLDDAEGRLVLEAARAINDTFLEAARPALAAILSRPSLDEHVIFRALNANYRLGKPANAKALAEFAAKDAAPAQWRIESLHLLSNWAEPSPLDYTMNLYRPLEARDAQVARDAAAPALQAIFKSAPDDVKAAAVELMGKLKIQDTSIAQQLVASNLSTPLRVAALQLLADRNDPKLPDAVQICLKDKDKKLRAAAIRLLSKLPDGAARLEPLASSGTIVERQAVYDALAQVHTPQADKLIAAAMDQLLAKTLPSALELEVVEAAKSRSDAEVHSRYAQYQASLAKAGKLASYHPSLEGGDVDEGRRIFKERADVSCIRCHTAEGQGGKVGPVLDGIATRQDRNYMLESIVDPNAKIAPGFESANVKTKAGKSILGVVRRESPEELVLVNNDGGEIVIKKSDIASRTVGLSAMPQDISKTLTPRDLRNLVSYLASLKKADAKPEDKPEPTGPKA